MVSEEVESTASGDAGDGTVAAKAVMWAHYANNAHSPAVAKGISETTGSNATARALILKSSGGSAK